MGKFLFTRHITLAVLCAAGVHAPLGAQTVLDSLRARAVPLAGCYRFLWADSLTVSAVRLPHRLILTTDLSRSLGYHRLGFFQVHPAHLEPNSYVIWRPRGTDSLQIELDARPVTVPSHFAIGRLRGDTLTGQLQHVEIEPFTPAQDLPHESVVPLFAFMAVRGKCR
jgi:hypothetical protein